MNIRGGGGGGGGGGLQGSEYWWGGGHFVGCKLIAAPAPNQCQIFTSLILKTDNISSLRILLKSIFLEIHVSSNKIKGTFIKLVYL